MAIETAEQVIDESAFPGRQGRLAFAFLALAAQRPVARDALADALWGDALPGSWENALKSILSKLRTLLVDSGLGPEAISAVSGCYQLRLPVDAWIDLEASARAIDAAEGAIRRGEIDRAWSESTVVTAIARRPFLPGEDAPWVDDVRSALQVRRVRALETLAEVWLTRGNAALAITSASEALGLEPYRETGYRMLMRAHALAGNRAEAVRTYDRCVRIFADELGIEPDLEATVLRDRLQVTSSRNRAGTRTIVVTDIVASTQLTARLGDQRWAKLLARHDGAVRDAVAAVDGRVVKHLGDGFLLTFDSVGAALRAVRAMQSTIADDDGDATIAIRVGVHAGEPIELDDDLFGLQVNVAARISALAGAGETLVSSVVRDLAPPGDYAFYEPRTVTLKGVPDPVTVYGVVTA